MNNEETILDGQMIEPMSEPKRESKKSSSTEKVVAAAAGGAVVGAGATFAGQTIAANAASVEATDETPATTQESAMPSVAIVDQTKDFTTAFNEARDTVGPGGVFEYQGKLYNTYTEDEWNKMSAEDQNAFAQSVKPMADRVEANYEANQVKAQPVTAHETVSTHDAASVEVHHVDNAHTEDAGSTPTSQTDDPSGDGTVQASVEAQPEDNEIHVLGVEHNVEMNGETVDVAAIEVGGHNGLLVDVGQDGTADIGFVDINGNGQIDPGEAGNITQQSIPMPGSDPGEQYMSAASDMPDYTNDATLA